MKIDSLRLCYHGLRCIFAYKVRLKSIVNTAYSIYQLIAYLVWRGKNRTRRSATCLIHSPLTRTKSKLLLTYPSRVNTTVIEELKADNFRLFETFKNNVKISLFFFKYTIPKKIHNDDSNDYLYARRKSNITKVRRRLRVWKNRVWKFTRYRVREFDQLSAGPKWTTDRKLFYTNKLKMKNKISLFTLSFWRKRSLDTLAKN